MHCQALGANVSISFTSGVWVTLYMYTDQGNQGICGIFRVRENNEFHPQSGEKSQGEKIAGEKLRVSCVFITFPVDLSKPGLFVS